MFKVSELVECRFVDGVNAWAIMNMQLHCYTMLHPAISKYIALGKLSTKLCGSFELSGMMWDALAANWRLCFDILTGVPCRILHRYWIRVLAKGSERGTAHGTQTPRLDSADSGWLSKVFARPFPWFPLGCVQNCSLVFSLLLDLFVLVILVTVLSGHRSKNLGDQRRTRLDARVSPQCFQDKATAENRLRNA